MRVENSRAVERRVSSAANPTAVESRRSRVEPETRHASGLSAPWPPGLPSSRVAGFCWSLQIQYSHLSSHFKSGNGHEGRKSMAESRESEGGRGSSVRSMAIGPEVARFSRSRTIDSRRSTLDRFSTLDSRPSTPGCSCGSIAAGAGQGCFRRCPGCDWYRSN